MPSRRQFLSTAVMFSSCSLLRAQAPAAVRRRAVIVAGRRVKTVDVHAHCVVPEAVALMGNRSRTQSDLRVTADRLRVMDDQGIDVEALSINPFWYATDRDLAAKIIQVQNEKLAAICAEHPDRFVAYATVALQHPDLAVEQLEHGMKNLGLRGASLGGNINGEELSAKRFNPFWKKAEELGALVFIHPQGLSVPDLQKRLEGNGFLSNVIGNPLETTIALSHLIFDGTLDTFPGLKICAAHGGGFLPSYADRFDHGCMAFPANCPKGSEPGAIKKQPTEYLRQLYFDSLVFSPEALRHLVALCGASQIMVGTDYPYPWTTTAIDHVLGTPGLSAADQRAILGETAARLLRIQS
jgi:aminocarboxymuconate-semialdehyde decarboxylase